jgi:DNA repair exonuclease SbcCD ATPase subunit
VSRTAYPNLLTLDGDHVGQDQVVEAVGLTFEAFTNTVLLGQGQPLFFDLTPKAKMDLFSDVLSLQRWEQRAKLASDRAAELESQGCMLEGTLIGVRAGQVELRGLLKAAKADYLAWDREKRARTKVDERELSQARERLKAASAKLDEADVVFDGSAAEVKAIDKENRRLRVEVSDLKARVHGERIARETRLKVARDEIALLSGKACPTCGQNLTTEEVTRHRVKLKKEIAELEKNPPRPPKLAKLEKQLTNLELAYNTLASRMSEAEAVVYTQTTTVASLRAKLAQLERSASERDETVNPHEAALRDLRERAERLKAERLAHAKEIAKLRRRLERTRFWVRGFKDVRLYVIDEVLHELQLTTNAALEEMGLAGWEVQYAVEKETKSGTIQRGLNVSVLSPTNREPVRWECWSGGEGQRLRLLGALALSQVLLNYAGLQTNLEVLDEPTQHLSAEGVRDLCDWLSMRARHVGKQTWYVDHQSVESARFASVTTVVKARRGGARIEKNPPE